MKWYLTFPVVLFALLLAAICACGSTVTWTNTSGGNWSDASSWNPNQVPDAPDTAVITNSGNYSITLDVNASVSGLVLGAGDSTTQTFLLNGQTFTLAGQATVNTNGAIDLSSGTFNGATNTSGAVFNGALTCNGGALSGTLTLASNSVFNLAGPSNPFNGLILFTNYGTVVWLDTDLIGQSDQQFYNYGLWDAQTNKQFYSYGDLTFNNYGTFRKSGGALGPNLRSSFIYYSFNNFGTIDVQIGVLFIWNGYGSGVFNTTNDAKITSDEYTLTGSPTFTGTGFVDSGNIIGNNAVINGNWKFPDGAISGTLTIASNATLTLEGYNGPYDNGTPTFSGTILTNYGTVIWLDTDLGGQSNPQIYNYSLWDAKDNQLFYGGGMMFNNYGIVRKSGGTPGGPESQGSGINNLNNFGTLDAQIGQLLLFLGCSLASKGTLNCGINSPNNFGSIWFDGNVPLAGTLSANFNNGYSPAVNDSFPVVGYYSSGTFDHLNLPHLTPTLAWQTDYDNSFVTLSIVAASPLQLSSANVNVSSNSISFSWDAQSWQTYQVQWTTNLAPANWVDLGAPISGTNGTVTVSDVLAGPQKFYRVNIQ